MLTEIRARYANGLIEPLEELDLAEGDELVILVRKVASKGASSKDAFERAAGGWKDLVDTDQLLKDFRESRRIKGREIRL